MAAQDGGDAGLGHGDAELSQLADDAQVAPAGVLPGQAHDQLDSLLGQRGTAWPAVGEGPAPTHEGAVPAKDRLGRDKEGDPPLAWHQLGQGDDERPIRPGEAGTC